MTDITRDTLVAELELGIQAEEWFRTPLGQYVLGCIDQEIESAKEDFTTVDVDDVKGIRELQDRIKRANTVKSWFAELIERGRQAERVLTEEKGY